jgi:cardiolipin synthase
MPDDLRRSSVNAPPSSAVLTLANAVTLARLGAVPAIIWLVLREDFAAAFWLFAAAGASDAVDGWLARRRGATAVGALLDPVSDKVLLVSLYVTLAAVKVLPDWLAILVLFRDLVIVGGVLVLAFLGQKIAIRPLPISKLNTVLQIVLVLAALLQTAYPASLLGHGLWALSRLLIWLVAATTLVSGAAYILQGTEPR